LKSYLRALSFLTVIPLPFVSFSRDGNELSASAACFPLAGATMGLVLAGAAWLLLLVLPPLPVAVIALVLSFFLTRGLHIDGLADTADGLIGTTGRDKAFMAMEDSSVGVMGAASIIFTCLLKAALLASLDMALMPFALVFMPLAGRWAIVYAGAWYPPARERGLGDLFLRGLHWPVLLKATLLTALLLFVFAWWYLPLAAPVLVGCLTALASAHLLAFYVFRRLGGLSGDILGAISELGELFFLLGFYIFVQ